MIAHNHPRRCRRAQLQASTVFALTLATVAGLIGALVVKGVFLDRKGEAPAAAAPTYTLTVAAANLTDRVQVHAGQVKTISVSRDTYERAVKDAGVRKTHLLVGSQPVGRTTLKPVRAEEPFFEDELEPMQYPRPVSELVSPGKRAVILAIGSRDAMVQVGDRVDVSCTVANDNAAFGPGNTATAWIVRGARVLARFNTTRTAAVPPAGEKRTYTLEVTPYRYALIELAKTVGANFGLSVAPRENEDGATAGTGTAIGMEPEDPDTDRVTTADLARLFGITDPTPEKLFELERFSGLQRGPSLYFPVEDAATSTPAKQPGVKAASAGDHPARKPPVGEKQTRSSSPEPRSWAQAGTSTLVASRSGRALSGFHAPLDPHACHT